MTVPAVGEPAPDFGGRTQHGETLRLSELRGGRLAVVFYPWAFSGICRSELAALRDRLDRFEAARVRVLAVSCDAMFTLRAYADSEALPFDLVSDHWPHGAIARAYGIFDDGAGCARRGTFLLDADGTVRWTQVNGIGEARDIGDLLAVL